MSEIADFSKLTIDVLRLIERFTYLTKSNRFNLPNLINLIELMNKYGASNREIWMALAIDSELKTQADSRWEEVQDHFQQGDVDFINARRLLKDPRNIKDNDLISDSSLMSFGALVTARTQYLFDHPSTHGWKNESERQINAPILLLHYRSSLHICILTADQTSTVFPLSVGCLSTLRAISSAVQKL